eukprot:Seg6022.2 transcript_id=Seg6022.2/GoldUCD/mRNA.D3Y31 product="hypothetical protein" protein_id=Seg6022.2/GoldUCD/D3Y31
MADEEDASYVRSRRKNGEENENEVSQWNESCYGIWLNDTDDRIEKKGPVCLGINIVHITKRVLNSKVTPSATRGIQIIIEEMGSEDSLIKKDESIGEDGMIAYRAPQIKRPPKDEDGMNQPSLTENIMENFKQKAVNIEQRFHKYRDDPASVTELWYEFKEGTHRQFETGRRLLGYARPSEKMLQLNTFFQQHFQDAVNWFNERGGK